MSNGGTQHMLRILCERLAPSAIDAVCQEVIRLSHSGMTDQTTGVYLLAFDVPRNKADERMVSGGGFPNEFVSILHMQNASFSKYGKSLVSANIQSTLPFAAAAKQMRRLVDSCANSDRQDVSIASDADVLSVGDGEHAA